MDQTQNDVPEVASDLTKPVTMRLRKPTRDMISKLGAMTGYNNTQVVAASVSLAHLVFTTKRDGGEIYMEKENGEVIKLVLLGL